MRFIIDALQVDENAVCYCAFTGKAAEVLRKKGNKNCLTLHKLLYDFKPRENGGFFKIPKTELEYNIIVVDEISMAPKGMMELLFTYDCDVLKGLQPLVTFNNEINKLKYQKDLYNLDNTLENISSLVNLLNVEPVRPVDITIGSLNTLMVLNRLAINCNSVIDLMRTQSMIESEKKELDNLGGEEFDCPIYGKIKLVNEDCIPVHI